MRAVYIETSVPSFYFETRTSPRMVLWREATRLWWQRDRARYRLVVSEVVEREVAKAPGPKATAMSTLIADLDLLPLDPEVLEIAAFYRDHRLLPAAAGADALHIALASFHRIEFLLTWNVRHLANANKREHLSVLNRRLGLPVPTITTPELLVAET